MTGITGYNESLLFLIVTTWPFAASQAVPHSFRIYG